MEYKIWGSVLILMSLVSFYIVGGTWYSNGEQLIIYFDGLLVLIATLTCLITGIILIKHNKSNQQ